MGVHYRRVWPTTSLKQMATLSLLDSFCVHISIDIIFDRLLFETNIDSINKMSKIIK